LNPREADEKNTNPHPQVADEGAGVLVHTKTLLAPRASERRLFSRATYPTADALF